MSLKYEALLQPLRVRNLILRNRMLSTASTPHFLQGTESAPLEKVISHFANRAKNGAAAVSTKITFRSLAVPLITLRDISICLIWRTIPLRITSASWWIAFTSMGPRPPAI